MKDINTLEEEAKKYTTKKLAMEFIMFQGQITKSFEKIFEQQDKLSELLNKLTLEVTIQKPEVTRFKAFITTIQGTVVAVLLWAVFQYFSKPKIEPVVGKRTEVEVKIESEQKE